MTQINLPTIDPGIIQNEVRAEQCRRSFFHFVQHFWKVAVAEEPIWNWHIEAICNELQTVAECVFAKQPKQYDLIINVSPGSTKSTVCSIMFPAWVWSRAPHLRTICGSYAHSLALDLSVRSRKIVQSPLYRAYYPEIILREDQNTKSQWTNRHGGERYATSTGGSVTGMHAHFLIVDDPMDPAGVYSDAEIKAVNQWFDETLSSRKTDKVVTPTILIMQRLGVSDLTGHLLEKKGKKALRHVCLPCDDSWEILPKEYKEQYKDGLMDPVRLSRPVLDEAKVDLGSRVYAGQYGQSPRPLEGNMFNRDKFEIVEALPDKIVKLLRYWDKAGTKDGTGAQTAGVLLAELRNGTFAVLDCVCFRKEAQIREKIILMTAHADREKANTLRVRYEVVYEQEPGSGGKESAQATDRMLAGFNRYADLPQGDKVLRSEPWSVEVNNGGVVLVAGTWNLDYINEHADFPFGKLKDRVDSSAAGYSALTGLDKRKRKRAGLL